MSRWKSHELRKMLLSSTGVGVMLLLVVLINVILSYANIRWDTTEEKIYSLSQGSKNILSNLSQPVTVKFFWSRSNWDFPRDLKIYAGEVRDFLAEYEYAGDGKFIVEDYDPEPDSDQEEWAQRYGLRGLETASGDVMYCGLVFTAADREERIPLLDPGRQELLEYDITRIIHHLQSPRKNVVGIISDLPVFGVPIPGQATRPWIFVSELMKSNDVRDIPPGAADLPPDLDLLLIIHPKSVSQQLRYAIDQYVLRGGNVMAFIDPLCISDTTATSFMKPPMSVLPDLLQAWGVSVKTTEVLVDFSQSTRVRAQGSVFEESPLFISAGAEAFNRDSVVTSKLESMLVGIAGVVRKEENSPYEFEPLVLTSENSAVVPVIQANMRVADIRKEFTPSGVRFPIAARVQATFKSAFPDGPPAPPKDPRMEAVERSETEAEGDELEAESHTHSDAENHMEAENDGDQDNPDESKEGVKTPKEPHLREGTAPSTIIVVADADMLADFFYVETGNVQGITVSRMFNDNYNFLANGCEMLTGSDDLIAIRSRGTFQRPFTTVQELERKAQDRWLAKEQELARQAAETNRRLSELHQAKDDSQKQIISEEQENEIRKFQEEKQKVDRELKEVRKNLRADIESLGTKLQLLNTLVMPLCVIVAGLGFAFYRQRRMRKR